ESIRCHLALNQVANALTFRKRLEGRPLEPAARILFINHYLALGRNELAKGNPLEARDQLDAARAEIKAVPESLRTEPAVVWADAMITASQPERKLAKDSGGPTNIEKAEKLLKDYAGSKSDFESQLLLVRWQEFRRRLDDANAVLAEMEQRFGDQKKTIDLVRARLALLRSPNNNIPELVAALHGSNQDVSSDVLQFLYLTNPSESGAKARTTIGAVLGQNDSIALYNLWNGVKAQKAGSFGDAAGDYSRALSPSRYQSEAQAALLTSLLALAAENSPKAAAELIDRLRNDSP